MILSIKFKQNINNDWQRKKVCLNFFDRLFCNKFDIFNNMHYFNNKKFNMLIIIKIQQYIFYLK